MKEYHSQSDKAANLMNENRKIDKLVKAHEEKIKAKEDEIARLHEANNKVIENLLFILCCKLKDELKGLLEENHKYRELINKLENQNTYLRTRQEEV
jgi:hypothetical protein